jgi:molybdate transport system ATP-binding protein
MTSGLRARLATTFDGFRLDVDLQLPGSGITALLGASGAGKTTCLRAIAGLARVPEGFVSINGELWQDESRGVFVPTHRRALAYVFQEGNLFAHLNVRRNLDYGVERAGGPADPVEFAAIVELLGIAALLDRNTGRLSGGERQRIAIARALLMRPRLLLLDEPLAAIDTARKEELLPYLERLHDTLKIPCLYVTHNLDEASRLADHLVILERGAVVASGPLQDLMARVEPVAILREHAGVMIEGTVVDCDVADHLLRVSFSGGEMSIPARGQRVGARVRCRIEARDVSLTLERQTGTSILNVLAAKIETVADGAHPAQLLVRLDVSGAPLLAQVTRRSWNALQLSAGRAVWAQIKAVAVIG